MGAAWKRYGKCELAFGEKMDVAYFGAFHRKNVKSYKTDESEKEG
jgi:hypothetical protein